MSPEATQEADDDADASESPTVDSLSAIIQAEHLQTTIDILQTVGSEAIMRYGNVGVKSRLVGPANVYMATVHLEPDGFEAVGDGQFPAGTDLGSFGEYVGKADSDAVVELSFKADTRYLSVRFDPFERDFALIDPDSIRKEPYVPEMDLPNRFEIRGDTLQDVVDVSQMVSDHVRIEGDIDAECIRMVADGDRDTNTATLDEELGFADVSESVCSILSLDYLADAVSVVPKAATVEIRFGDEKPVHLEWDYADGHGHVHQMIAPRIQSQ